jgi:transcriptional regulator with XRE-family HTH domain
LRSIASERALATRIAYERAARDWTYEGLAARMTGIGCSINASAIYKIEKGDPPRRITVDELVALGRVFALDLEDLVQPVTDVAGKHLGVLLELMQVANAEMLRAAKLYDSALSAVEVFARKNPEAVAALESVTDFKLADVERWRVAATDLREFAAIKTEHAAARSKGKS